MIKINSTLINNRLFSGLEYLLAPAISLHYTIYADIQELIQAEPIRFFYGNDFKKLNWIVSNGLLNEPNSRWYCQSLEEIIAELKLATIFYTIYGSGIHIGYEVINPFKEFGWNFTYYDLKGTRISKADLRKIAKSRAQFKRYS